MESGPVISAGKVLWPVIITLSVPFAAAQIIRYLFPSLWKLLVNWKDSSFYILIINIYIATSEASHYIRSEMRSEAGIILLIALLSALLCVLFFLAGWIIGGKEFSAEASQSLGQKNNAFTIWVSLSFVGPLAALGPVFYVLFQNFYVSWELYRHHISNSRIE
jgi:BASS family bile acid:Na+ symporter